MGGDCIRGHVQDLLVASEQSQTPDPALRNQKLNIERQAIKFNERTFSVSPICTALAKPTIQFRIQIRADVTTCTQRLARLFPLYGSVAATTILASAT